jgi:hypothetical protein
MLGVLDLIAAFVKSVLAPIALTNGNKSSVQMAGGGGVPTNFVCSVGAGGGSATITLQESSDNATWTALNDKDGNQVTFALAAGDANTSKVATGYRTKGYVRAVVASVAGTIIAGVNVIEGNVYAAPTGDEAGVQTSYDAN